MSPNIPVTIERVGNGFILTKSPGSGPVGHDALMLSDTYVFRTIEEVAAFLKKHFPETFEVST